MHDDVAQRDVATAHLGHVEVEVLGGGRAVEDVAQLTPEQAGLLGGLAEGVGGGWGLQAHGIDNPRRRVVTARRQQDDADHARRGEQEDRRQIAPHLSSRRSVA